MAALTFGVAQSSTAAASSSSLRNVVQDSGKARVVPESEVVTSSSLSLPSPHDFAAIRRQIELDEVLVEQKYDALNYVLRTKVEALAAELKRRGRHIAELQAALEQSHRRCDVVQTAREEELRRREAAERQLVALRTATDALEKRVTQSAGDAQDHATLLQRQSEAIDLRLRLVEEKEASLAQRERAQCVREEAFEASLLPMRQEAEAARKHASSLEAMAQRTRDEAQLAAESISAREDSIEIRERALRTLQGLMLSTLKEREEMLQELQRNFLFTVEQRAASCKRREDSFLKDRQSAALAESDASFWQAEAESIELRFRACEKTCRELETALIAERDARKADMERWDAERQALWDVIRWEEDEIVGRNDGGDASKESVLGLSGDHQRQQLLARLRRVQTFIASSSPSAQYRRSSNSTVTPSSASVSLPTHFGTTSVALPIASRRATEDVRPSDGLSHCTPAFASFYSSSMSTASSTPGEVKMPLSQDGETSVDVATTAPHSGTDVRRPLQPPRPIPSSTTHSEEWKQTPTTQYRPNRRSISSPLKAPQTK